MVRKLGTYTKENIPIKAAPSGTTVQNSSELERYFRGLVLFTDEDTEHFWSNNPVFRYVFREPSPFSNTNNAIDAIIRMHELHSVDIHTDSFIRRFFDAFVFIIAEEPVELVQIPHWKIYYLRKVIYELTCTKILHMYPNIFDEDLVLKFLKRFTPGQVLTLQEDLLIRIIYNQKSAGSNATLFPKYILGDSKLEVRLSLTFINCSLTMI